MAPGQMASSGQEEGNQKFECIIEAYRRPADRTAQDCLSVDLTNNSIATLLERNMVMRIFLLIALLIALIAVIFALQNTQVVSITFLAWTFQSSIALEMVVTLIAGVVVGILAMLPASIRSQLKISSKKKEKAGLEASLAQAQQQVAALQKQLDESNKTTQAE
jgi:putative membrane protein